MTIEQHMTDIRTTYAQLKQAAHDARHWYERYVDDVRANYRQRLQTLDAQFDEFATLRWISLPWNDPAWEKFAPTLDSAIPAAVRLGRLALADDANLGDLPAFAPFIGAGHLFIQGEDAEANRRFLQTILLRLLVSFPPGTLRFSLADPVGAGANLSAFLRLPDTLRGVKVCWRPEEIAGQLSALSDQIESVLQTRLLNVYPTLEAYNAAQGEVAVPYSILALNDFPAGLDEHTLDRLVHIARNGPRAGVYIVATLNPQVSAPRDFDPNTLLTLGTLVQFTAPDRMTWPDPEFGKYPIVPDPLPAPEQFNRLLSASARIERTTNLAFTRIAIPEPARWTGRASEGLSIPVGLNSAGEIHHFVIGEEGGVQHGLLGGITQSGKTNLLHVILTQLALRYSPEQLELYLVDYKVGVEFADYVAYGVPHVRVAALETDREFGVSVLRRLQAEIEARGDLFKQAGVTRISEYHARGKILPRIVVVMDEFQVLFSLGDRLADEAARLFEDLTRRGAAFGIHLLLSSQSPSNAGTHSNRLYNQLGLRIALQCLPNDARAILGEGNDAASQLERPGEAIYNDKMGDKNKNVFFRAALLELDQRRQVLSDIQKLAFGKTYARPLTFEGRAPARLETNLELIMHLVQPAWLPRTATARVWLGEPIEIKAPTAAVLQRYGHSNLIIAGGEDAHAYGLLTAALLGLAAQRAPADARFIVADLARPDSPFAGSFARFAPGGATPLPHPIELAAPRQAGATLAQLVTLLAQRQASDAPITQDVYFFIVGLQRWREARGADVISQTEVGKQLIKLADEGPELGIHLLASVDGASTLDRVFKRGGVNYFDLRVVLNVPEQDSLMILEKNIAKDLEENRALFRDEDEPNRLEKFKPYALPDSDTLLKIVAQLRTKTP